MLEHVLYWSQNNLVDFPSKFPEIAGPGGVDSGQTDACNSSKNAISGLFIGLAKASNFRKGHFLYQKHRKSLFKNICTPKIQDSMRFRPKKIYFSASHRFQSMQIAFSDAQTLGNDEKNTLEHVNLVYRGPPALILKFTKNTVFWDFASGGKNFVLLIARVSKCSKTGVTGEQMCLEPWFLGRKMNPITECKCHKHYALKKLGTPGPR